jgi:hypothetical protein
MSKYDDALKEQSKVIIPEAPIVKVPEKSPVTAQREDGCKP